VSELKLSLNDAKFMQASFNSDFVNTNIRLREGEYQYNLAKVIASFQLELHFPDVKDIIRRLYGEEKTEDIQFIRRIQTILKKMEKSNIVKILPKKRPWELQRYSLSSLKFRDSDKNVVVLATEQETKQSQDMLKSIMKNGGEVPSATQNAKITVFALAFLMILSYSGIAWALMQPLINSAVFIVAFSAGVVSSIMLGRTLSRS
jgi:predicted RNA binding protein YcfA (HicA-like mRNA interferase family)